jgi:hypothetical protein
MSAETDRPDRPAPSPDMPEGSGGGGADDQPNAPRESSPEGAPPASPSNPPSLSAEELHEILSKAHVVGHRARRKFIVTLAALSESRLYLQLGFSNIAQYAEKHFGSPPSLTYEYLHVAKALRELPRCDRAFLEGKISWTALREISRVANRETEGEWLELIEKDRSIERLKAEVRDAQKSGRRRPRRGKYGLPRLTSKLSFELDPEEMDLVSKAVHMARREIEASLGGETVEPKDAFLFISRNYLETGAQSGPRSPECGDANGQVREERSAYTILYQCCPDCRKSYLPTADGPVEIPEEVVRRVEGDANQVEISPEEEIAPEEGPAGGGDEKPAAERESEANEVPPEEEVRPEAPAPVESRVEKPAAEPEKKSKVVPPEERDRPNPPGLVTKIYLRDGGVCQNPLCRRRGSLFHCHHIVFRSHGGRTALYNESLVCTTCHSLLHAGLLVVEGNPATGLVWKTKSDLIEFDFLKEIHELTGLPDVRVAGAGAGSRSPAEFAESAMADSEPRRQEELDADLTTAMVGLGYSRRKARARLAYAREVLTPEEAADEATLLGAAFRGRPRRPGTSGRAPVRD